ncbi:hypothetical protein BREVNS_1497 [Brevinematales bacterium NS]|nr:hypothetical protein BREVNS_1497 [Brevinematales bacterium NS]
MGLSPTSPRGICSQGGFCQKAPQAGAGGYGDVLATGECMGIEEPWL